MRKPVLTPENVRVETAKPWGWNLIYPASRRGKTVYSHWFHTQEEALAEKDELLARG